MEEEEEERVEEKDNVCVFCSAGEWGRNSRSRRAESGEAEGEYYVKSCPRYTVA